MVTSFLKADSPIPVADPISPISLKAGRDGAVDLIKGLACLLMVAAHSPLEQVPWLYEATMGAVLFFASTGMNLAGIVERRTDQARRLAMNAFFLIFAGFADNYVQGTMGDSDVFQLAGMAILAMLLLRRILPGYWTWLFPLPFLLHWANQHLLWKSGTGGIGAFLMAPGLFPLLPWLGFFLLGAHLKTHGERRGWWIGAAALGGVGALRLFGPFHFEKFWMSPDYFLLGCVAASWTFAAFRRWLTRSGEVRLIEIRRWGANSLVFYIMSNFVIVLFETVGLAGFALFLASLGITALLLRPALRLQAWTAECRPGTVLAGGSALSAVVLAANAWLWPDLFYPRTFASFGLTFAFIACYPAWKNLTRNVAGPTARAKSDSAYRSAAISRPFAME